LPERDGYIPGVPCWVDTTQPDPEAAAAFYGELFGWELENVMPDGGQYLIARIRGGDAAAIGGIPEGAPPTPTWNTYIQVDSADDAAKRVYDAGGRVISEPFDVTGAGRMAVCADPEGAVFCVWEPREHKGAKVVNEHGAVNFNGLHTRDVEAAKRFYGAVFGWTTLEMPTGAQLWTLPGYGDHLEEATPGLRKMVQDVGAPGEFIDVVASINPIPEGDEASAHWSVTFGADDADAVAERTAELGGKVLVPPFDAPWSRVTVLADPQGATFIASKFVPENKDVPQPEAAAVSG
jgi:predicted enzyme related to lactoylglutathione lyase